jgi:hypothetical protein
MMIRELSKYDLMGMGQSVNGYENPIITRVTSSVKGSQKIHERRIRITYFRFASQRPMVIQSRESAIRMHAMNSRIP